MPDDSPNLPNPAEQGPGDRVDATVYVPRLSLELALAELSELIGKTPACAALTGEPGLGKTLLLHVLHERLCVTFECLYVPFGRLDPNGFWSGVAVAIGLGSGDDDRGAVLGRARSLAADGSGLVLLVDDAGAIPPAFQAELIAACETPGLSLVLAFADRELAQLGTLPAQVRRVDLGPPMTPAETRAYLQTRLRQLDPAGSMGGRLGTRTVDEMHDASGGVPARLEALLYAWRQAFTSDSSLLEAEPAGTELEPPRAAASEHTNAAHEAERAAAKALRDLGARFERPAVRLGVTVLFVVLIGGFWYFALQRSGTPSVGVPVERFETQRPAPPPAPKPAPSAEQAPTAPAASAPATAAPEPAPAPDPSEKASAKAASAPAPAGAAKPVAAAAQRPSVPREEPTPKRDLTRAEEPVEVVSAKFPDEHVPATLEVAPLAPRPGGPLLNVNATPWAKVRLDGKPVGETPLGELALSPGTHLVTATLPDGRVIERRVEAKTGDVHLVFE